MLQGYVGVLFVEPAVQTLGLKPGGFPPCHHHTSSELGPPTSTVVRRASTNSVKYLAVCVQRCLRNLRFWGVTLGDHTVEGSEIPRSAVELGF